MRSHTPQGEDAQPQRLWIVLCACLVLAQPMWGCQHYGFRVQDTAKTGIDSNLSLSVIAISARHGINAQYLTQDLAQRLRTQGAATVVLGEARPTHVHINCIVTALDVMDMGATQHTTTTLQCAVTDDTSTPKTTTLRATGEHTMNVQSSRTNVRGDDITAKTQALIQAQTQMASNIATHLHSIKQRHGIKISK